MIFGTLNLVWLLNSKQFHLSLNMIILSEGKLEDLFKDLSKDIVASVNTKPCFAAFGTREQMRVFSWALLIIGHRHLILVLLAFVSYVFAGSYSQLRQ